MSSQFFTNSLQLIQMFSAPSNLSYETQKYFDDPDYPGLKAIECFESDIEYHLTQWMTHDNVIFYKTVKYWYIYELDKNTNVINCTRFCNSSYKRWDTWMNVSSTGCGKSFLINHLDKRVFK